MVKASVYVFFSLICMQVSDFDIRLLQTLPTELQYDVFIRLNPETLTKENAWFCIKIVDFFSEKWGYEREHEKFVEKLVLNVHSDLTKNLTYNNFYRVCPLTALLVLSKIKNKKIEDTVFRLIAKEGFYESNMLGMMQKKSKCHP